ASITHVLDRLTPITSEQIRDLAPYLDVAKIGWGLPLLLPRERVRARLKIYHAEGVEVSTGGTLLEYAYVQNRVPAFLDEARSLGFDLIEISSGILELSSTQIARLADAVRAQGLPYFIEVGKKDPQHQLSLKETIHQIEHARSLRPRKVIVERPGVRARGRDLRQ
ncbi:(2R)-phospho-3-sulfolactate synthase, ComA, partial [mine drainage metagenome]